METNLLERRLRIGEKIQIWTEDQSEAVMESKELTMVEASQ